LPDTEVLGRPELKILKSLQQQLLQLIKDHSHTVKPLRALQVTKIGSSNAPMPPGENRVNGKGRESLPAQNAGRW